MQCFILRSDCVIAFLLLVSNTRDKMTFHWTGPNAIEDGEETGSMALSPVLKNHNAYLVHNETLYCDENEEWRGEATIRTGDSASKI